MTASETVTSTSETVIQKSILRRIKKLLDHAEHRNADPNEAAIAAAQAAALMARHRLDRAIVEAEGGPTPREPVGEEVGFALPTTKIQRWMDVVICAVTSANDCKYHFWWNTDFSAGRRRRARLVTKFVGRPTDRQAAKLLVEFVVAEIERLARAALARRSAAPCCAEPDVVDNYCCNCGDRGASRREAPRTYGNNFRLGAAETVSRRLREAAKARASGLVEASTDEGGAERAAPAPAAVSAALVLISRDRAEVDVYYKDLSKRLGLRSIGQSKATYSREGREAGRRAGEGIHLGQRLDQPSSPRRIGGVLS